MSVCKCHLAGLSHEILQVLPADTRRQVLHNQTVFGAHWRRVPAATALRASAIAIRETSSAATGPPATAASQADASVLDSHPLITQLFAIEFINRILSIPGVVKFNKAKAFLQVDISDASVSFEEPLHILLPGRGAQAADEDATPAHVNDVT